MERYGYELSGTTEGGQAASITNRRRYGSDFYPRIASIGGSKGKADGVVKGFATNRDRAVRSGRMGGKMSRRTAKNPHEDTTNAICTYCDERGHKAYTCAIRKGDIEARARRNAARAVEREQQAYDRQHLSKIAQRFGKARPW